MEKKNFVIIIISLIMVFVALCIIGVLYIYIGNKDNLKETVKNISKDEIVNETINVQNNTKNEDNIKEVKNMYSSGIHHATIVVKDYGTIKLELDADTAPITVTNFANLANEGFYNGLTFHRIMDGFMIQGGDPLGDGTGGSDENIKGEFKINGVKNKISHKRGVISMARATGYNTASSQFFIVHKDSTFLDGQYAGFGRVTEGMEVIDEICKKAQPIDNNGTIVKEDQPVIEKIIIDD